jgi:hypothetical protein
VAVSPHWYYSGGATNDDPSLSIGGAMSSVMLSSTQLGCLFDTVTGDEATAGEDEYRCLYCKNDGTTDWVDPVMWITEQPNVADVPSGETLEFGLEAVRATISASSVADPSIITTAAAHGLEDGATVVIAGHSGSTPSINGSHVITVIDGTSFSIPVDVTVGGTGGTVTGTAAKNTVAQTIADTYTAPLYVVFDDPATKLTGTDLPTPPYAENDYVGVWFHRHTPSSQPIKTGVHIAWEVSGDDA